MTYRVEEKNGWSYVRPAPGDVPPRNAGPYRYPADAQEYADELNQTTGKEEAPAMTIPDRIDCLLEALPKAPAPIQPAWVDEVVALLKEVAKELRKVQAQ